MKSNNVFLEKYEETVYFKISRAFWHLLLILSGVAALIGVLLLIWGVVPSSMRDVKKPNYPPAVKVSADELKRQMAPPPATVASATAANEEVPSQEPSTSQQGDADKESAEYKSALAALRALLPRSKFLWTTRGHWVQTWMQKQWVVDAVGIQDNLAAIYAAASASDFASKTKIVQSFVVLLSSYPVGQRGTAFMAAAAVSKESAETAAQNISLLKQTVSVLGSSNAADLIPVARFIANNPKNGAPLIEYADKFLLRFDAGIRKQIFATLIRTYARHFRDNLDGMVEVTNLSLDMISGFAPADQNKALLEYYRLYQKGNHERSRQIARMDSAYQNDLAKAQADFAVKKAEKEKSFTFGWFGIAGGVVAIALVALFLVLLSIQRNIKLIREDSSRPEAAK